MHTWEFWERQIEQQLFAIGLNLLQLRCIAPFGSFSPCKESAQYYNASAISPKESEQYNAMPRQLRCNPNPSVGISWHPNHAMWCHSMTAASLSQVWMQKSHSKSHFSLLSAVLTQGFVSGLYAIKLPKWYLWLVSTWKDQDLDQFYPQDISPIVRFTWKKVKSCSCFPELPVSRLNSSFSRV